jgi:hypothetical protein
MSGSNSYNPANNLVMKNYLFMMTTAAKAAIDTSIEMRRQSGKLKLSELSSQDVKEEVSKYKSRLDDIHRIALREAKAHAKRCLSSSEVSDNVSDDNDNEDISPPQKRAARKRPRFDLTKFVPQKTAKRVTAENDVIESCQEVVKFLNEKYGNDNNEYKLVDSERSTLIKISRITKGTEYTYCLIGKSEFDRNRQQKVKEPSVHDISRTETVNEENHVVHNLYNAKDELVKSFKAETVHKGDILRANAKGGSAIPVPAIRGNIMTDIEEVKARLSKQGIQITPVTENANEDSSEAEVEAEAEVEVEAEADETTTKVDDQSDSEEEDV